MTAQKDSGTRDVIPRWRSVRRTIEAGEFQSLGIPRPLDAQHVADLARARRHWARAPNEISAGEFVGASLVADEPIQDESAAEVLRESSSEILRRLASFAIDSPNPSHKKAHSDLNLEVSFGEFKRRIARGKSRVRDDPRNAIAWADLARRYTALGQFPQADRALTLALALAPDSRYLHRIASRFYVHIGQPERAFWMLNSWERTQEDPWLMSALLSVASVGEIKIRSLKQARRIVESMNFRPIEKAELASEVGTLELRGGNDRKARSFFKTSLTTPTDNSLAQVEWASEQLTQLVISLAELNVPFAAEAHARSAAKEGRWDEAWEHAVCWLDDQPFDTEAAIFGSYVAAVAFERWDDSAEIAQIGLRARPKEVLLMNNLAYALVEGGRLQEAADVLASVDTVGASVEDQIALTATQGLLLFRLGDATRGFGQYQRAIEVARQRGLTDIEGMARSMLLREELRLNRWEEIPQLLAAVQRLVGKIEDPGVLLWVHRIEEVLRGGKASMVPKSH